MHHFSFQPTLEIVIEANKLSKGIGKKIILDGVNFKVLKGNIHGLIGANGSGKSTTLKILCGLINPTSGIARIKGLNIQKFPEIIRKNLGYIPENPRLYPSLTIEETLTFIGSIYSMPKKLLESQIDYYINEFNLQYLNEKFIVTLSRGELQRVLLCSIFMRDPEIIILDEPFYSLDPINAKILRKIIKEKSENGTSFLIATHLLDVAEKVCDTLTIIDKGKTVISGNLKELKNINNNILSLEDAFINYVELGKNAK